MEDNKKSPWQPTDEQRATLEALQAEAGKEKTTVDFARKFLPWGRSLYDQMMDALNPERAGKTYFDKISEAACLEKFEELKTILAEIPRKRLQFARQRESTILVTSKIRAVETAVREAAVKPGPERIVLVPGPTGAGKTMTSNYLAERVSARLVEVRSSWRDSKTGFVPLQDICRAVGVRVKKGCGVASMQDDLVAFCEERSIVLCFDEGEHFGKAALNLLKFLLNKTRIVVVLFVVPAEFDKWQDWFPNESGQIARRIHSVVETSVLDASDVAMFFPKDQFADSPKALELIARDASRFGHFSLVKRVADLLANVTGAEDEDVRKAIKRALVQMKRA